jgi:hypothetical protein
VAQGAEVSCCALVFDQWGHWYLYVWLIIGDEGGSSGA